MLATTNTAMNIASPPNDAVTGIKIARVRSSSGYSAAPRVPGQHLRAAGGRPQAPGVEARAREYTDRVDPAGLAGKPHRLGVGQEDHRLL